MGFGVVVLPLVGGWAGGKGWGGEGRGEEEVGGHGQTRKVRVCWVRKKVIQNVKHHESNPFPFDPSIFSW